MSRSFQVSWPPAAIAVVATLWLPLACCHESSLGLRTRVRRGSSQNDLFVVEPPPPQLEPLKDGQPADTALGKYIVDKLSDGPTRTPPPSQEMLDIASACPMFLTWPKVVELETPGTCTGSSGNWTTAGGAFGGVPTGGFPGLIPMAGSPLASLTPSVLGGWTKSCWTMPVVTYRMPNGDLFGSSRPFWFSSAKHTLFDCSGRAKYVVEERVYHEKGLPHDDSCYKYHSCDGTVWIQYFIKLPLDDQIVAKTQYLHIFQDSFPIFTYEGIKIAQVTRVGHWVPNHGGCTSGRKWMVEFMPRTDQGLFSVPSDQWPIASMVAILSKRDATRRPSGLVSWTWCEIRETVLMVFAFITLILLIGLILRTFSRVWLTPLKEYFYDLEVRMCPPAMRRPSKFENN
mmetsp:Transcript_25476/g.49936  ORF Transcript_25476/g.49936 Transcript_25476/m.49936 type:complete len:400 (+) Transcript_25476:93-1292(+)